MPPLLSVRGLERSFYGVRALHGVDLTVERATITGLIGPNGAGKTTLFHCVSGVVPPEAGVVVFDGDDITGWRADRISRRGLVRTFQIARGVPRLSVLENLMLYGGAQPGERLLDAVLGAPGGRRREDELRERAVTVARRLNLTRVLDAAAAELLDHQEGQAVAPERLQVRRDLVGERGIDAGDRLVQQHQLGVGHERAAELEKFLLPARVAAGAG